MGPDRLFEEERELIEKGICFSIEEPFYDGAISAHEISKPCKLIFKSPEMSPPASPLLLAENANPSIAAEHLAYQRMLPSLGCYLLENVRVGMEGVVVRAGKILYGEDIFSKDFYVYLSREIKAQNQHYLSLLNPDSAGKIKIKKVQSPSVLLSGPGYNVYGHWLLDFFPRVWLFRRMQAASVNLPRDVKYIIPTDVPKEYLELLQKLFGISGDDVIFYRPSVEALEVSELYIPSMLRIYNVFSPLADEYIFEMREKAMAMSSGTQSLPERIFVSRRHWHSERKILVNREEVAEILSSYGFVEVYPEQMPWHEQVVLFSNAKMVAGEFGSGMHNMVFSHKGTTGLVFLGWPYNFVQSGISFLRKHELSYLLPDFVKKTSDRSEYRIDPLKLKYALYYLLKNSGVKNIPRHDVPWDFDWKKYVENYPDLRQFGIDSEDAAIAHWILHGKDEKRIYKNWDIPEGFDWRFYLERYPDLAASGIDTEEKAIRHWLETGRRENRICKNQDIPKGFDWKFYLERYPDLAASGIDTEEKAVRHWLDSGRYEGRVFKKSSLPEDFDWKFYVEQYPDLQRAGIVTEAKAIKHWLELGERERRTYRELPVEDPEKIDRRRRWYLSVFCMFGEISPQIIKWIEYHKTLGVEHFFLYLDHKKNKTGAVLWPYVESGEVDLIEVAFESLGGTSGCVHRTIVNDCILYHALGKTEWLAILDMNEWLIADREQGIPDLLKSYEEFGGVVIPVSLNTGGESAEHLTTSTRTGDRQRKSKENKQTTGVTTVIRPYGVKRTVIRPSHVNYCYDMLSYAYKGGQYAVPVDETDRPEKQNNKK